MKICVICGENFKNHALYANHVRWKHKNNDLFGEKISSIATAFYSEKRGKIITVQAICEKCKSVFAFNKYENDNFYKRFCSRSCANSKKDGHHSVETRLKISKKTSESIKKKWVDGDYDNVEYKFFKSKDEMKILSYLKEKFPNDGWTSGGTLKIDDEIITRDAYSLKLKTCLEYDGVWHFKNIHNQLKLKQKKDKLLNEWCNKNGWKMIRISETYWYDNHKNFEIIDKAVATQKSIFLGKEYM